MSIVLITGAVTGIGRRTAETLAAAGHVVYATMRGPGGRDAAAASEPADLARDTGWALRVAELDVTSQASADAAVRDVADEIRRILSLPVGEKPFRSVVDAARAGVDHVMAFSDLTREAFVRRLGYAETLELRR